ncbi:cytochrome P450 [Lentinula lateritia]|nr:cytochrome P450 [Lentinula lateritia]
MFPASFCLILTTCVLIFLRKYMSILRRLPNLPGPPTSSWLFGHAMNIEHSPIGAHYNIWAEKYGSTYRLKGVFGIPVLSLADPKGVNHVLNNTNYKRNEDDNVALELFFGRSVFCVEGHEHKRVRKYLNSSFTSKSVANFSEVFFNLAYNLEEQWNKLSDAQINNIFDITPTVYMLTLDAISITMFNHNLSATKGEIPGLLNKIANAPNGVALSALASLFPLLLHLPSPMKNWCQNLRTRLGIIAKEVWSGKEGAGDYASLLQSLAQESPPISQEEAVAQIIGILFAGSETTANVICECFHELARQPEIQHRLREELSRFEALHGHPPGHDDLMNPAVLPYFDAVTKETMRTKAILVNISREDVIPLQNPLPGTGIYEIKIPAGILIHIPVRDGINVDKKIWGPDASTFNPDRWVAPGGIPDTVKTIQAQGHMLTFGDGPKVCLGRAFALAEFKIVVSIMVRKFNFELDGSEIDFYHLGGNTIKPMVRGRETEGVQLPLKVKHV